MITTSVVSTILFVFILGYTLITLEHKIKINKAAPALLAGMLVWAILFLTATSDQQELYTEESQRHMGNTSSIVFFILGAMTVVELMDAHEGFSIITDRIATQNKRKLLWIINTLTFFMSALLDNMTTAIVMCALTNNMLSEKQDRWIFAGTIVISANAGGAWSPIGDVTTIMLWIKGNVTTSNIMTKLFVPSVIAVLLPLALISRRMKDKTFTRPSKLLDNKTHVLSKREQMTVFVIGIATLLGAPTFKILTHLPPFMGILLGLAVLWLYTEIIHREHHRGQYTIAAIVRRIDHSSVLFFLGILIAVAGLETAGILNHASVWLDASIGNLYVLSGVIGALSSIVDNVPLVAAVQGMYPIAGANVVYPTDHLFWEAIALSAGTGGSMLVIGSAAGVAAMGVSGINFGWYLRKITVPATIGYLGSLATFWLQNQFFH